MFQAARQKDRKAAFSVAWMKLLGNVIRGKPSQERLIVERFLVGQRFEDELVHAVLMAPWSKKMLLPQRANRTDRQ